MRRFNFIIAAAAALWPVGQAEAAAHKRFDIRAGKLADALVMLGRQGGVSIGLSDMALANQQVAGVSGSMSVRQALSRLLRKTDARFVEIEGTTFLIVRRPPPQPPYRARRPLPITPVHESVQAVSDAPEIIVTAAKRNLPLADYPGAAEIVRGGDLNPDGAQRGSDALVLRLPSLSSTYLGSGRNKLFLRGIADSSFTGATQSTVGQYLGDTRLNYNGPDPDLRLVDMDRVEVLPGPQGTLYGAGSLGGILRLVPNEPRFDHAEAEASAGASATWHGDPGADASGVINIPFIQDQAALRIVAYGASEGGYIDDLRRNLSDVNRTRIFGGRAAMRFDTTAGWSIKLGMTGQLIRGDDSQSADRDAPPLSRRSNLAQNYGADFLLGEIAISRQFNQLSWITAAGAVRHRLAERFDATRFDTQPQLFAQNSRYDLLSVESRLTRETGSRGSGWTAGISLVRSWSRQKRTIDGSEELRPAVVNLVSEAALFAEASVPFPGGLIGTAGGRLAYYRRSASVERSQAGSPAAVAVEATEQTAWKLLPTFAISTRPSSDLHLSVRYQESFRSGGFGIIGDVVRRYKNDSVKSVEVTARWGTARSSALEGSVSLSYTSWKDIQADVIDSGDLVTANIGDGRIYSLDAKLSWRPVPSLELGGAFVYNDSLVTDPRISIEGSTKKGPLPNVARVNARVGVNWRTQFSEGAQLQLFATARYVGRSRLGVSGILSQEQGDWFDVELGARATFGRGRLTVGVSNLLDTIGNRFAFGSPILLPEARQITPLRPRTLRVGWELGF